MRCQARQCVARIGLVEVMRCLCFRCPLACRMALQQPHWALLVEHLQPQRGTLANGSITPRQRCCNFNLLVQSPFHKHENLY